jgi:hypothetical protein
MAPQQNKPAIKEARAALPGQVAVNPLRKSRSATSAGDKPRQWIVILIFIVYWLLIFEGVLRKWVFPSLHQFLYFIRDPFVLTAYIIAIRYRLWPRWTPIFSFGVGLGGAFFVLALIQAMSSQVSPIIVFYGWRNYFFYLPFAFIIGEQFRGKDLAKLVRETLYVAIPISILCYQQFKAPADSALNGSYNANSVAMLVAQGIVRTSGTFTVSAAQTLYISSVLSMLFAVWLLPASQRPINRIGLYLSSAATLAMFAVSGARSVFLYGAIIAAFAFAAIVIIHYEKPFSQRKKVGVRPLIIIPTLILIGAVCYVKFFPTAFSAMMERQRDAQVIEGSTLSRALSSTTSILRVLPQVSIMGAGIGAGTNAASMVNTGQMGLLLAEDETQRIILEAGIFGFLYVGLRFWMTGWIGVRAYNAIKRSWNPLPFALFGFESLNLLYGQMTLQGTVNGYGWLFAGFCMAANNLRTRVRKKHPKDTKDDLWS